jgi:hypothetical protein
MMYKMIERYFPCINIAASLILYIRFFLVNQTLFKFAYFWLACFRFTCFWFADIFDTNEENNVPFAFRAFQY